MNSSTSATHQLSPWQKALKWLRIMPRRRYRQVRAWFRRFNSTTGREWREKARVESNKAFERTSEQLDEFSKTSARWYEKNRPKAERAAKKARIWTVRRWWEAVNGVKIALSIVVSTVFFAAVAALIFFLLQDDEADAAQLNCEDCSLVSVVRVIDGDTLDTGAGRIRLYGIDAPERGEDCFDEATDELKRLASSRVRTERGARLTDPFDRNLRYLYTEAGASIDELLVSKGLAVAWTQDGQHRDHLMGMQGTAMQQRTGCLWR